MNDLTVLIIIGLLSGILSGLVGIGGGILIVPALVYFLNYSQLNAQGTSLAVLLLPVGILAVMNYYKMGHINVNHTIILGLCFVPGAYLGSYFVSAIPVDIVKKLLGCIMLYTAFKLINPSAMLAGWFK